MAVLALVLALVALPLAILDLRLTALLLLLALATAALSVHLGGWRPTVVAALVVSLVAATLGGWELWERHRPPTGPAVDAAVYARPGTDRDVLLPLTVTREPVERLALLHLDDDADPIYSGFEPQLIARGEERGVRIIGYRHDGYVDLYDDLALTHHPDQESRTTGRGRLHQRHTDLGDPVLGRDAQGRAHISFSFTDVEGREIVAALHETSTRSSLPLPLLAPVGRGSQDPEHFPFYLLPTMDFLRLGDSSSLTVDGHQMALTPFPAPIPVQGQMRSFSKLAEETEIIQVFPTEVTELEIVRTTGDVVEREGASYLFTGPALERIRLRSAEIVFDPPLDVTEASTGRVTMVGHPGLGQISATYRIERRGTTSDLSLAVQDVVAPQQRGLLYRLIVNDRSAFATWPLAYRYAATLDLSTRSIEASWTNTEPG